MDELTRDIYSEVSWCMLLADDIVLIDETRERVNDRLEVHNTRQTLRSGISLGSCCCCNIQRRVEVAASGYVV